MCVIFCNFAPKFVLTQKCKRYEKDFGIGGSGCLRRDCAGS